MDYKYSENMLYEGVIRKMKSELSDPVEYLWELGGDFVQVNQAIGRHLHLRHLGYQCLNCGESREIFNMGYCKPCFFEAPGAAEWIVSPELSKAHLDQEDRDLAYEKEMQLQPHVLYLAETGNVKVGVTRKSQIPTRWIDQGASAALPIAETPNRYLAGIAEAELKGHISDKTSPTKMLTGETSGESLEEWREKLMKFLPEEVKSYTLERQEIQEITYPVKDYPVKVKTFRMDKDPDFGGVLKGIRGQYLIFEDHRALNLRGHEGYVVGLDLT